MKKADNEKDYKSKYASPVNKNNSRYNIYSKNA